MEVQLVLSLLMFSIFLSGTQSAKFTFTNNCAFTVWPATLSGGGTPQLSSTGFELPPKASFHIDIPPSWSGRFWARSHCSTDSSGKFKCDTADCGSGQIPCNGAGAIPPASLLEFTLNGSGGKDFYDISLVDGFNLPVSIQPQGSKGCNEISCAANINVVCPSQFAVKGAGESVIACRSACLALDSSEYCCTGEYGTPDKCPPTNYSQIFKRPCPQAYSYAYDDQTSTFTCTTGASYAITFCP